jgi:hypothetical protein
LADLSETRERYKGILEGLPPSSDKEFFRSKRDLAMKKARSHTTPVVQRPWWQRLASTPLSKRGAASGSPTRLNKLLLNDPSRVAVLQAVRDTLGSGAWIWGGFVRDPVWDRLEGYVVETPLDDVDVCFYDPSDTTREHDQRLEHLLRARCPNVKWSVKNQARPDLSPEAEAFDSLEAAVRAVPETATAVAVRLDRKNRLQVLAPLGLDDLFRGVVRPTRAGSAMRYERRLREKEWNRRWPCVDELDVGETR